MWAVFQCSCRQLRIGDRVREGVSAPLPSEPARTMEQRPDEAQGGLADSVLLELAKVPFDVVWTEGNDPPRADRVLDVAPPHPLVASNGARAQILPTVGAPSFDGIVDRRRSSPAAILLGNGDGDRILLLKGDQSSQLLLGRPLPSPEQDAALFRPVIGVSAEKDAELPGVQPPVLSLADASRHAPEPPRVVPT